MLSHDEIDLMSWIFSNGGGNFQTLETEAQFFSASVFLISSLIKENGRRPPQDQGAYRSNEA